MITFREFLNEDLLFEDFGNLKKINSYFRQNLFIRGNKKLDPRLGQNSEVKELGNLNPTNLIKTIEDDKFKIRGAMVLYDGKQIAGFYRGAFIKSGNNYISDNTEYTFSSVFNIANEYKNVFKNDLKLQKIVEQTDTGKLMVSNISTFSLAEIKSKLNVIVKIFKEYDASKKLNYWGIYVDQERSKMAGSRSEAKRGMIPVKDKQLEKEYTAQLKKDFMIRLDKFKLSKVKNGDFSNPVDIFKETGFPKKVMIEGFAYTRKDSGTNLSLQDIVEPNRPDAWHLNNYIEYDLDRTLSVGKDFNSIREEYREFIDTYKELKGDDYDHEAASIMALKKKIIPASRLRVVLGLVGTSIQVVDVQLETRNFF